jgi:hypothetical protein
MSHFVAFSNSFQDIVTFKLPFGANRGFGDLKNYNLLVSLNSFTYFRKKSAVFTPK